jgi:formylglycine-generating enzyme required for sulfatase activity
MGDDMAYMEESPAHEVEMSGFWIDTHEVTNEQFGNFVQETGYITVAERLPDPADWPADVPVDFLKPGSVSFTPPSDGGSINNCSEGWVQGSSVRGAAGSRTAEERARALPCTLNSRFRTGADKGAVLLSLYYSLIRRNKPSLQQPTKLSFYF